MRWWNSRRKKTRVPATPFKLDSHHLVFAVGQDFYASAKFPNPDSSLVDIAAEDGIVLPSFVEKNGHRQKPIRRISASQKSRMTIPNHLEIVEGDLNQIEQILSSGEGSSSGRLVSGHPRKNTQ